MSDSEGELDFLDFGDDLYANQISIGNNAGQGGARSKMVDAQCETVLTVANAQKYKKDGFTTT